MMFARERSRSGGLRWTGWLAACVVALGAAWLWAQNGPGRPADAPVSPTPVDTSTASTPAHVADPPPVTAPPVLAQTGKAPANPDTPNTPPPAGDEGLLLIDLFKSSLIINSIILALSVLALLLFVYLLMTINASTVVPPPFVDDVMKMVLGRQYKEAVDFCRHHRGIFVSSIIQRCVENPDKDHAVLMEIADTEGRRRADILWNRISYLSDIANVAPMLGLLGTVVGMMGAFFKLDEVDISIKSKALSSDIAGAMSTTMFGLVVAILALVFYSIAKSRATRVLADAEQAVHSVADHIKRAES